MQAVNEKGLSRIRRFLRDELKDNILITDDVLSAYAESAESSMMNENGAQFEVSAMHTWHGRPVVCRLRPHHIDNRPDTDE